MITGNANNTVAPGELGPGDTFVKDYLETELGHAVTVRRDVTQGNSLRADALAADLVLVVESVTSTDLTDKLKDTPTPVINYEAFIQDDMGFTASGSPGPDCDPGPPSGGCTYGAVENHDRILVGDSAHPLAAGFSDTVTVYSVSNLEITWGTVAPSAEVVATLVDDTTGAVIYVYQAGATLFDGTSAAGLRVGFFLEDDNETGTANFMTPQGRALFEAVVAYALDEPVSLLPRAVRGPEALPGTPTGFQGRDLRGRQVLPD